MYNKRSSDRGNVNPAIFDKVCKILSEQFDVNVERIDAETSIINDFGADSLDVIDLLMTIEDEFEVLLMDTECENVRTVGELVADIAKAEHRE